VCLCVCVCVCVRVCVRVCVCVLCCLVYIDCIFLRLYWLTVLHCEIFTCR